MLEPYYRILVTLNDPILLCFMVTGKNWPFCHRLQEVYASFHNCKKQMVPIKKILQLM